MHTSLYSSLSVLKLAIALIRVAGDSLFPVIVGYFPFSWVAYIFLDSLDLHATCRRDIYERGYRLRLDYPTNAYIVYYLLLISMSNMFCGERKSIHANLILSCFGIYE